MAEATGTVAHAHVSFKNVANFFLMGGFFKDPTPLDTTTTGEGEAAVTTSTTTPSSTPTRSDRY